jgi:hypothetical protein
MRCDYGSKVGVASSEVAEMICKIQQRQDARADMHTEVGVLTATLMQLEKVLDCMEEEVSFQFSGNIFRERAAEEGAGLQGGGGEFSIFREHIQGTCSWRRCWIAWRRR